MYYQKFWLEQYLPPALTMEEQQKYWRLQKQGDKQARDILLVDGIYLVKNCIRYQIKEINQDPEELLSIGLTGLMKSIDTYDPQKGASFSTYATVCIRNEILMYLRKEKKQEYRVSLESYMDEKETTLRKDFLKEEKENFTLQYDKQELSEEIRHIWHEFSPREQEILFLYFGFCENTTWNQEQLAERFSISQSYISRLLRKSLQVIRTRLEKEGLIESAERLCPRCKFQKSQPSDLERRNEKEEDSSFGDQSKMLQKHLSTF